MEGVGRTLSVTGRLRDGASSVWEALAERASRQQITVSGFIFTILMTTVGMAAFASANNLLFLLFAALISTMLISGFVSRLGLAGLELELRVPEHVAARRRSRGRLFVRNSKYMPSFSVYLKGEAMSGLTTGIYFPALPARSTSEEFVDLEFARRGIHRGSDFQFSTRFPFGFTERRARVRLSSELLVYPAIESTPYFERLLINLAGEIEARDRGRGHDFYRIRPYEYLEDARHVDWKKTAHAGQLQVREFAREEDRTVTLFLDLDINPDERAAFETAVECCAFLAWQLERRGAPVRLLTQQFDRAVPANADVYAILRYLALVEPLPGAAAPNPDGEREPYLALTARPGRLAEAGWLAGRIVDLRGLGADPSGSEDGDHGNGKP
jgi:uncharacterized protein (DUF58 family)